ncbi:MAG: aldo/keto reductase [Sedimentisphaeraceae bacterium JB056]
MDYRPLGRTGVKVSSLCLGCMNFGGKTNMEDSSEIMDHAIDSGINFFDTANVYSRGESEKTVGAALKANGKRDKIVLATKVHGKMDDDDVNAQGNNRRHIIQQCEASLKRLKTDWIDLYQIHRPDSTIPIDETLRALDDLIRAGKVRYVGTSTFAAWQMVKAHWIAKELGLNRFICEQPPYNLLDRRIERELIPMAISFGMAIIPWSPLASGFLTGKYKRNEDRPEGSRLKTNKFHEDCFEDRCFDVVEEVEKMAKEKGCTPSQLSLAWCVGQPGVTSPIIGPRTMEQLKDNLGALDVELDSEYLARLDKISEPGHGSARFYEADFGPEKFVGLL